MKNQLLLAFLIFTSISYSQTWNLVGNKEAKLTKNGTGLYVLKYKSEYGSIYTDKITRQRREEGNFPKNIGQGGFIGFFKLLGPSQEEEESISAVYEFCKTDDPDYEIVIVWANVTFNYEYKFKGIVGKIDVFGEMVDTWFIY